MQVRIDDREVRRVFTAYPHAATRRLNGLIEDSAIDTQREMRMAVNVGATGDLRRSIGYKTQPASLSATIGPSAVYAEWVEKGTRPHWTSARPGSSLHKWATHKGLNPYAVQRSIARKGTKKHPFIAPTYRKMRPRVERLVVSGMARFIKEVDRGII